MFKKGNIYPYTYNLRGNGKLTAYVIPIPIPKYSKEFRS